MIELGEKHVVECENKEACRRLRNRSLKLYRLSEPILCLQLAPVTWYARNESAALFCD